MYIYKLTINSAIVFINITLSCSVSVSLCTSAVGSYLQNNQILFQTKRNCNHGHKYFTIFDFDVEILTNVQ